ncbi:MAG: hypothetical protein AAGF12_30875 [Myxococcota bacterium]
MRRLPIFAFALMFGCAPATPLLWGGATTPNGRVDVAVGSAALATTNDTPLSIEGVAPVATIRHGIARNLDWGVGAYGALGFADLRWEPYADDASALRPSVGLGLRVYGGLSGDELGRLGAELPVMFQINATSLLELWVGGRVGLHAIVAGEGIDDAIGLHVGPTLGLAGGFRNLHALVEVSVLYFTWNGSPATAEASGAQIVPAASLRYRF